MWLQLGDLPIMGHTRLHYPEIPRFTKFKIFRNEESPDNVNSYGPLSVSPPVGATYIAFPVINEGSTCIRLWRFRALEFNSTDSVLKLPNPIEEAIMLLFVFFTSHLFI